MNASLFNLANDEHLISAEMQSFLENPLFGTPNWKWIALVLGLMLLSFLRRFVLWAAVKLKKAENYFPQKTFMHFFLEQEIEKGVSWIVVSACALILIESLSLNAGAALYISGFIKAFLSVNVIRICYFAADAFGQSLQEWAKTTDTDLDDHLAPFASKFLKVMVIIVGSLVMLQNFGINVTALLAGLGIGGVALAFAAQDTVSNVFGTITILLDRPFKHGDWVKIGETEGTIEELGFRSTRVRTFYNSLITLPNSVVAKEKIDNLTERRGWIRFRHTLGFTYDANPGVMRAFSEALKAVLAKDPSVDHGPNRVAATFNSFGDSSLNMLVNFHYRLNNGESDLEKINSYLDLIFTLAQEHKLEFAFPTRTLVMQNLPAAEPAIKS